MKKHFIFLGAAVLLLFSILLFVDAPARQYVSRSLSQNLAGVFFVPSITVEDLLEKYKKRASVSSKKINILLVPGHEPDYGGTEYKNLKERDLVVLMAESLEKVFKKDSRFNVTVARDENNWHPALERYFDQEWQNIIEWRDQSRAEAVSLVESGELKEIEGVEHNDAPHEAAIRLYGINKWVNENNIDIVLHLHLNDVPRKNTSEPGDHTGFAIYIPEQQYSNAVASREIAEYLKRSLELVMPVSTLTAESLGIVEGQELIAIGRYNTVDAASLLIEYGYIYQPMFEDPYTQKFLLDRLAEATYIGIKDFFRQKGI